MLPELEPYFAKYYDRWLNYSQYICTRLGIRREAYDIMADTLVEFCIKSDDVLSDLLDCEKQGNPKFYTFVRKAILYRAIDLIKRRHIVLTDVDGHLFHLSAPDGDEIPDEIPDAVRETEASLRDDSFMNPIATAKQIEFPKIGFAGFIDKRRGRMTVTYRSAIYSKGKVVKSIKRTSRGAVMTAMIQYQMQHQTAQ